ncbi:hypothetical protein FACS1894172_09460 [Spirochaetia bacterium]|nr:hypothetical protein FACS1894172_09460 [Spirochaetia bacterium]
MNTIQNRLIELRKSLKLTQAEFAEKLDITQATVSARELGKIGMSDKEIKSLCNEFGVNEMWLRTGEGDVFYRSLPSKSALLDVIEKLSPPMQDFILETAYRLLEKENLQHGGSDISQKLIRRPVVQA